MSWRYVTMLIVFSIFILEVLMPMPLIAWGDRVHKKMTSDAYHIMPKSFREFLGETSSAKPALKPLLEACIEPDLIMKDFGNHIFHIHGYGKGNGPFKIDELAKEIVEDIKNKAPIGQIIRKLGWLAHYIEDLAQPLHTGVPTWEGIEEKPFHKALESNADDHVYEFGVFFDGAWPVQRISARMIYEALWANQYYSFMESTFISTNKDPWKVAKPIVAKCYSRAVNNVVDIWYSIWVRAGGKVNPKIDAKPKYYPPYNPTKPGSLSLPKVIEEAAE